jgi:hypothetical protein
MKVFQKINNAPKKPFLVESEKEAIKIRKGLSKYFYNLKKGIGENKPQGLLNNRELVRYCIFVLDSEKEYEKKLYLYAQRKKLLRKCRKRRSKKAYKISPKS